MSERAVTKNLTLKKADPAHLEAEKERLADISGYLKRYVAKTFNKLTENHFVLALFSSTGAVLKMYPSDPEVCERLLDGVIREGDTWEDSGYNAVTEGLKVRRSRASKGEENEMPALKDFAVYFSVMNILEIYEPYEKQPPCGIAIIAPLQYAWDDYFAMVVGIAHDIMLNVQFKNVSTMYYERSGKGLLVVDTMLREGENVITYCNDELFRMLGVKKQALLGVRAESLICPLPENARFWDIVANNRKIREEYMELKLVAGEASCLVSTDAYRQPAIKSAGVVFYITNDRKRSEEVSKRVANGAVKTFDDVIGEDPVLLDAVARARRMASTDSNVLILGESGTGKDVFAQAIHNASRRRNKPFVAINCGAIPRDLMESELFGYEAGTFTGARKNGNMGKFELATGGTIFLDEIGEMPLDLQSKLLRVVEQKQLMRLGGSRLIDVDVKIIAATNIDMREMIRQRRFREDLFYRLSTMRLHLMPLRERRGDIIPLTRYFIRSVSQRIGRQDIMQIAPDAADLLYRMEWHGNVRELQNLIECIVQLYPDERITARHIRENAVLSSIPPEPVGLPEGFYSGNENTAPYYATPGAGAFPYGSDASGAVGAFPYGSDVPGAAGAFPYGNDPAAAGGAYTSAGAPGMAGGAYAPAGAPGMPGGAYPPVGAAGVAGGAYPSAGAAGMAGGAYPPGAGAAHRGPGSVTREDILAALAACGNNRSKAAAYLGIPRRTFYRRLEEFGIE